MGHIALSPKWDLDPAPSLKAQDLCGRVGGLEEPKGVGESQHKKGKGHKSLPSLRSCLLSIHVVGAKVSFLQWSDPGIPTTLRVGPMVKRRWPAPTDTTFYVHFLF